MEKNNKNNPPPLKKTHTHTHKWAAAILGEQEWKNHEEQETEYS
jgi:hypothetical protein